MQLYNTLDENQNDFQDFLKKYLPAGIVGATAKEDISRRRVYMSHIALEYCYWIEYNQKWLNTLIFDLDSTQEIDEAYELCKKNLELEPTWICKTDKGTQLAFVLENKIDYEWQKAINVARRIKRRVTTLLKADSYASHRLNGVWRNPITHDHFFSANLFSLTDFYKLEDIKIKKKKRSYTRDFKVEVRKRKQNEGRFRFEVGNRNEFLFLSGMVFTQSDQERFSSTDICFKLLCEMQEVEAKENNVEKLEEKDLWLTARSIAKYNKAGTNFVKNWRDTPDVNRGAMGFEPIVKVGDKWLKTSEHKRKTKARQRAAAKRTNKILKENEMDYIERNKKAAALKAERAKRKVWELMSSMFSHEYKKRNGKWNGAEIVRSTGLDKKTVSKYIKEFEAMQAEKTN
jgi:hypothetical protein